MNASELIDLMERFYRADFDAIAAERWLGDPAETSAELVRLSPRDPGLMRAKLELHDDELVGIVLRFRDPVALDTTQLTSRWGEPSPVASIHYDQPTMQAYQVDEADFVGSVLVTLLDTDDGAHTPLARVIMRRIPKDLAAARSW